MTINESGFTVRAHLDPNQAPFMWVSYNRMSRELTTHVRNVGTTVFEGVPHECFEEYATSPIDDLRRLDLGLRRTHRSKQIGPCVPAEKCCSTAWDRIPTTVVFTPDKEWREPASRGGGFI